MRAVMVSAEISPYAKTGGLAEVVGMLSGALAKLGVKVDLVMPLYSCIDRAQYGIKPLDRQVQVAIDGRTVTGAVWSCPVSAANIDIGTAYFIENESYFGRPNLYGNDDGDYSDNCERFTFFCHAALSLIRDGGETYDVVHCHDWHTALIPIYMKNRLDLYGAIKAKTLLTIHNLAYQGAFWQWEWPLLGLDWSLFSWQYLEFYGKFNLLKGGIIFADAVSTVSKTYSREIQTPEHGCGLDGALKSRKDKVFGIINGLDYDIWNPATDPLLERKYDVDHVQEKQICKLALQRACNLEEDAGLPLVVIVGRLAEQKGLDLLSECFDSIMSLPMQLVILGQGSKHYARVFAECCRKYHRKAYLKLAFDVDFAHQVFAGADIYLMPSRYEPCGLSQLIAMRYGAVPVVHDTGGLSDTVIDFTPEGLEDGSSTGFVFLEYNVAALYDELARAIWNYSDAEKWSILQKNGMRKDWSFVASAGAYKSLYENINVTQ